MLFATQRYRTMRIELVETMCLTLKNGKSSLINKHCLRNLVKALFRKNATRRFKKEKTVCVCRRHGYIFPSTCHTVQALLLLLLFIYFLVNSKCIYIYRGILKYTLRTQLINNDCNNNNNNSDKLSISKLYF